MGLQLGGDESDGEGGGGVAVAVETSNVPRMVANQLWFSSNTI